MTPHNENAHTDWRCPKCQETYSSPIPVLAVRCGNHHGRTVDMKPEPNN